MLYNVFFSSLNFSHFLLYQLLLDVFVLVFHFTCFLFIFSNYLFFLFFKYFSFWFSRFFVSLIFLSARYSTNDEHTTGWEQREDAIMMHFFTLMCAKARWRFNEEFFSNWLARRQTTTTRQWWQQWICDSVLVWYAMMLVSGGDLLPLHHTTQQH